MPEPAPGTLIVRIELAGVCVTDAHMYVGGLVASHIPLSWGMNSAASLTSWARASQGWCTDFGGTRHATNRKRLDKLVKLWYYSGIP